MSDESTTSFTATIPADAYDSAHRSPEDLTDEQKAAFIERMTDTVSEFYLDEMDEDTREFVNVRITETAETGYAVRGEVIA